MKTNTSFSEKTEPVDVLFVDDSANLRRTMQLWFQTKGYTTRIAESAAEAEQIAAATPPRILITDLGLPDRSGYDLLQALRAFEALRQTHFVAFSGDSAGQEKAQAIEAGFDFFIQKPPDFDELAKLLQTCLHRQAEDQTTIVD